MALRLEIARGPLGKVLRIGDEIVVHMGAGEPKTVAL